MTPAHLSALKATYLEIEQPCLWLSSRGFDVCDVVKEAIGSLKGRPLSRQNLQRFQREAIFAAFLHQIAQEHKRFKVLSQRDQAIMEVVVSSAVTETRFQKTVRKFAHPIRPAAQRFEYHDFEGYVADASSSIAKRFLENYDTSKGQAVALSYLATVAVSRLLKKADKIQENAGTSDIHRIVSRSRFSLKTTLAVKLAYCPVTLNHGDIEVLRRDYGMTTVPKKPMKILKIAQQLGFGTAHALYQKFYKVRAFLQKSND